MRAVLSAILSKMRAQCIAYETERALVRWYSGIVLTGTCMSRTETSDRDSIQQL